MSSSFSNSNETSGNENTRKLSLQSFGCVPSSCSRTPSLERAPLKFDRLELPEMHTKRRLSSPAFVHASSSAISNTDSSTTTLPSRHSTLPTVTDTNETNDKSNRHQLIWKFVWPIRFVCDPILDEFSETTALPRIFVCICDYRAVRKDELDLMKGRSYIVDKICSDGWYCGIEISSHSPVNNKGYFPGNFVVPADVEQSVKSTS